MNEYEKYKPEIAAICLQYDYPNCNKCPLFSACDTERQDGETQAEYTERSEMALVEAYKKLQKEILKRKAKEQRWKSICRSL